MTKQVRQSFEKRGPPTCAGGAKQIGRGVTPDFPLASNRKLLMFDDGFDYHGHLLIRSN